MNREKLAGEIFDSNCKNTYSTYEIQSRGRQTDSLPVQCQSGLMQSQYREFSFPIHLGYEHEYSLYKNLGVFQLIDFAIKTGCR
jgi:hypothetical protein